MSTSITLMLVLISFFLGAVSHEADMNRNCHKSGDARAWFYDIKCKEMEGNAK